MFLISLKDKEKESAFTLVNEKGEKVLLFFEQKDDAERYKMMLEESDYPRLEILEYDDELMVKTAQSTGHNYTVITPYDLVVPPNIFN
jgi:hypothetical protein